MDILQILESAATEIRNLRDETKFNRVLLQNITLRVAIHQLKHGPIQYDPPDKELWNKLVVLAERGSLVVSFGPSPNGTMSMEAWLDGKLLTAQTEIK